MPFSFPPAVQSVHLNNFLQRLTHHLRTAPTSLMGAQEAFCKAGGYPNAHAAQKSKNQQHFLFIQRDNNHSVDVLPSVPTKHLFEWAKQSWKKHRNTLQTPHPISVKNMLVDIWGYKHWEDVEQRPVKTQSLLSHKLLRADTMDQLCNIAVQSHTTSPSGLYLPLGYQDNKRWVGTSVSQACCHCLVTAPLAQQIAFMSNLAVHRITQGDTLLIFCNTNLSTIVSVVHNAATTQGRMVAHIKRNSAILVPAYIARTRDLKETTQWLFKWINSERRPMRDPLLTDWLKCVAQEWFKCWDGSATNTLSALLDGTKDVHPLWMQLNEQTQHKLKVLSKSTCDWTMRIVELLQGNIVVVDMPAMDNIGEDDLLWARIAYCAFNPSHELSNTEDQNIEYKDILNHHPQKPLTTWLAVDTDVCADVVDSRVFMAQARAIGRALTWSSEHFYSQWSENTRYVVAHCGTKISLPSLIDGLIISDNAIEAFTPYLPNA